MASSSVSAVRPRHITGRDQVAQRIPHPLQVGDPRLKIGLVRHGQRPRRVTNVWATRVQAQQFLDLIQTEPEFLSLLDEPQRVHRRVRIIPVASRRARRHIDQATPLVVAQCLYLHPDPTGQLTRTHGLRHPTPSALNRAFRPLSAAVSARQSVPRSALGRIRVLGHVTSATDGVVRSVTPLEQAVQSAKATVSSHRAEPFGGFQRSVCHAWFSMDQWRRAPCATGLALVRRMDRRPDRSSVQFDRHARGNAADGFWGCALESLSTRLAWRFNALVGR